MQTTSFFPDSQANAMAASNAAIAAIKSELPGSRASCALKVSLNDLMELTRICCLGSMNSVVVTPGAGIMFITEFRANKKKFFNHSQVTAVVTPRLSNVSK